MGRITKDSLGDRMKQYESVNDRILIPKMPFIIRVDGKAFHTYTRGFVKPFDEVMGKTMLGVMQKLCEEIPGAVFGYTQSDEITIICKYTDRIKSQAWFGGRIRKIESVSAAKATKWFNKLFKENMEKWYEHATLDGNTNKLYKTYLRKEGIAEFDSRVFNIPDWDCINNIIWRQQDTIRNSIEMVGHANFSAKELHRVNVEGIKEKLLKERNINWDKDFTHYQKYGACCYKESEYRKTRNNTKVLRTFWYIDYNMPIIQNNREWFSEITSLDE